MKEESCVITSCLVQKAITEVFTLLPLIGTKTVNHEKILSADVEI